MGKRKARIWWMFSTWFVVAVWSMINSIGFRLEKLPMTIIPPSKSLKRKKKALAKLSKFITTIIFPAAFLLSLVKDTLFVTLTHNTTTTSKKLSFELYEPKYCSFWLLSSIQCKLICLTSHPACRGHYK